MKKSFAIIGLGRFGLSLIEELSKLIEKQNERELHEKESENDKIEKESEINEKESSSSTSTSSSLDEEN